MRPKTTNPQTLVGKYSGLVVVINAAGARRFLLYPLRKCLSLRKWRTRKNAPPSGLRNTTLSRPSMLSGNPIARLRGSSDVAFVDKIDFLSPRGVCWTLRKLLGGDVWRRGEWSRALVWPPLRCVAWGRHCRGCGPGFACSGSPREATPLHCRLQFVGLSDLRKEKTLSILMVT